MPKFYFQPKDLVGAIVDDTWCVAWHDDPVLPFLPTSISELIEPDALRLMQVGLTQEVGSAVAVLDASGTRIEELRGTIPWQTSPFCERIRGERLGDVDGNQLCRDCDACVMQKLKDRALPSGIIEKPEFQFDGISFPAYAYVCWAGLVDYACPIALNGKIIAVLFSGQRILDDSDTSDYRVARARAAQTLHIPEETLADLAQRSVHLNRARLLEDLEKLARAAARIHRIATDRYRHRRDEVEHYFREEIAHLIEQERETRYGVKATGRVLARLRDFFHLGQVYFLLNDINELNHYQILSKATGQLLTADEELLYLEAEDVTVADRISLAEISGGKRFPTITQQLTERLPAVHLERVWLGTCPLPGATRAFWLFINPIATPGQRPNDTLTHLDEHFLSRFCVKVRSQLASNFATSLVMRNLSHELGAGLSVMLKREHDIRENRVNAEEAQRYATRNICLLHRYGQILENIRQVFARRSRDSYSFSVRDVGQTLNAAIASFDGDAALDARGVQLHPATLLGDRYIEIDSEMLQIAFFNLVHNATKYSFDNRYVQIRGRELPRASSRVYEIRFFNYGVGILKEEIDKRLIFLEDYRGQLSRDRNRTGCGLGLAIVDAIIRHHGGSVDAKSIPQCELEARKSQYASGIEDPTLVISPGGVLRSGCLNIFTVTLPFRQ